MMVRGARPLVAIGASVRKPGAALALAACVIAGGPLLASSPADHPEPGRQGEILPGEARVLPRPYSRGVEVVGHSPIGGRSGNIQLAWIDRCAYVASTIPQIALGKTLDPAKEGVAVIDVGDPRHPRQAGLLRTPGSIRTTETIHALAAGGRKVLVAGAYAGGNAQFGPHDPPALDIYDARDCAHPRLVAQYTWPENAHTVTISPDGRYVYGRAQKAFTGHGGIMVLDIADLAHPRYLGKLGATLADGRTVEFNPHEVSVRADGRRIYAAVSDSLAGDLNPGVPEGFSLARLSPEAGGIYILDSSDLVDHRAAPKLRLIGVAPHGGWHSVMPAEIGGVPYLVGGGELFPCPGAFPKLVDIADERHPVITGAFRLAMNQPQNCPKATASPAAFGAPGTTLHYNDVDAARRTRLGLFNFTYAGLRIADLSDPRHPAEVAYFRPGDFCTGHVRYRPASGEIWVTCFESGLWVLRLAPEARAALR